MGIIVCQLFAWGICENLKLRTWIGMSKWFAKSLQNTEQSTALPKRLPTGTGPASLMPSEVCKIHVICIWSSMAAQAPVWLWQYHQFRWTCQGSISCHILTGLHARKGFSRPLAMIYSSVDYFGKRLTMFEMADHPSHSHLRGRPRVVSWERASNVSKHCE